MSLTCDNRSAKESVSLCLGNVTGDFLKSKGTTLYAGCCCCCCCFFWVGGLIGTAVGAVTGVRSKSAVKGQDYRFLMRLFWLSLVALIVISLLLGLVDESFLLAAAVGAPAAHVLLSFILVLVVGQIRTIQPGQRRSANVVCLKTFVGTLVGYGIGWLAIAALFS